MLLGLNIRNFRILRNASLGILSENTEETEAGRESCLSYPLRPLTVLVGDNSSGKSSLVEAISFLRDAVVYGLDDAVRRDYRAGFRDLLSYGSAEDIQIELCLFLADTVYLYKAGIGQPEDPCFTFEKVSILPDVKDLEAFFGGVPGREEFTVLAESRGDTHSVLAKARDSRLQALHNYLKNIFVIRKLNEESASYHDVHRPKRDEFVVPTAEPELERSGANVREWLAYWRENDPEYYSMLSEKMREILQIRRKGGPVEWLSHLTGAELNLFLILVLLNLKTPRSLLCIENPDQGLFPDKVDHLARELRHFSLLNPSKQVLMTTMQMNLLENMAAEEVWAFSLVDTEEDASEEIRIHCVAKDPLIQAMYAEGVGLGTLFYGGYFA